MNKPPELSWLKLEQRLLDELPAAEAAEVDRVLAAAPALARRVAPLELPPLDLSRTDSGLSLPDDDAPVIPLRPSWRWGAALGGLAAAAVLLLALPGPPEVLPGPRVQVKGGVLAIDLDRERGGEVTEHAVSFAPGDRFRVRVSCPPGPTAWDLVVFQGEEVSFPLTPKGPLACGNGVALPGAFTLDGGPAAVCVLLDPPTREVLSRAGPDGLGEGAACAMLLPAR